MMWRGSAGILMTVLRQKRGEMGSNSIGTVFGSGCLSRYGKEVLKTAKPAAGEKFFLAEDLACKLRSTELFKNCRFTEGGPTHGDHGNSGLKTFGHA